MRFLEARGECQRSHRTRNPRRYKGGHPEQTEGSDRKERREWYPDDRAGEGLEDDAQIGARWEDLKTEEDIDEEEADRIAGEWLEEPTGEEADADVEAETEGEPQQEEQQTPRVLWHVEEKDKVQEPEWGPPPPRRPGRKTHLSRGLHPPPPPPAPATIRRLNGRRDFIYHDRGYEGPKSFAQVAAEKCYRVNWNMHRMLHEQGMGHIWRESMNDENGRALREMKARLLGEEF